MCDDALFKILIRPKHTVVLSFTFSADILFSIIFIFLSWEFSHVSETEIQVCILVSSVYCSIMVNLWVQLELSLFVHQLIGLSVGAWRVFMLCPFIHCWKFDEKHGGDWVLE